VALLSAVAVGLSRVVGADWTLGLLGATLVVAGALLWRSSDRERTWRMLQAHRRSRPTLPAATRDDARLYSAFWRAVAIAIIGSGLWIWIAAATLL
jgi:hypothetical protein